MGGLGLSVAFQSEFLADFFAAADALDGVEEAGGEGLAPEDELGEPGDDDDGAVALDTANGGGGDAFGGGAGPTRGLRDFSILAAAGGGREKAGADWAGADGGDAQALTSEFTSQRFAETNEAEFAGAVGGEARSGDEATDAGCVDDVGFGLFEQQRKQAPRETNGGVEIDGEDAVPFGFGGFEGGAVPGDASVVDEDVEFVPELGNALGESIDLSGVGEIAGVSGDAELLPFEFGGDLREASGIAIDEKKIYSKGGETADDFAADAGGGASDQDFHAGFDAHGFARKDEVGET